MNKTALVTGANRGIGFEVCKQLAERNFKVFLTARSEEKGISAVNSLKSSGLDVTFLLMDVNDEESVKNTAQQLKNRIDHLDVLVNNAAILLDKSDIVNVKRETLINTLITNTVAPVTVIQSFLPLLRRGSRIINVSSGAGSINEMGSYAPAYSISKAGLNAVTKQFSTVLHKKGILINSVSPGWVRTEMGGPSATRSLKKGAETIIWLATDASVLFTGKFLRDKEEIPW